MCSAVERRKGRRGLHGAALLVTAGLLAAGCSSSAAKPGTFHPAGGTTTPATSAAPTPGSTTAAGLVMPPFGASAHIDMTSYAPKSHDTAQAVLAAKNFLLAVLYADYTGGKDHRWKGYVTGSRVRTGMTETLSQPGVTTESFQGTVKFWHMSAFKSKKGAVSVTVTECVDSSHALNTSLSTGKVLPKSKQLPTDQNFYSNSDVLVKNSSGQWRVISILPQITYPRAVECKE
ncbi:MAG TPA: hypothetical protein VH637_17165 [Streptosporangiaceae bacterium]|jgi:hypothetical protein